MDTNNVPPEGQSASRRPAFRRPWLRALILGTYFLLAPILVGAVALALLVNSTRAHNYLIGVVQSQASHALGGGVKLQNFTLHLSTLSVDLYGITVDGASPYTAPPLLQIQHAEAGIGVTSILYRHWYFESIQIDHPVVQIVVDKNGVSNIPKLSSSGNANNHTSVFDLGIRHAVLEGGEVYYNNQPSALAVDLHSMEFHASFNNLIQKYSGNLTYADGHLAYGTLRPPSHNVDVQFDATPTTFQVTKARITIGASQLFFAGIANNYADPTIHAQFNAALDGSQVGSVLHNPSVPVGLIETSGSLEYRQIAGRPVLDGLVLNGELKSRRLEIKTSGARGEIDNVASHFSLANGDASLHDLRADVLGGGFTAQGTMKNVSGNSSSHVSAALHRASLAELRRVFGRSVQTANAALTGTLRAGVTASWGNDFADLVANTDADIDGQFVSAPTRRSKTSGPVLVGEHNVGVSSPVPVKGSIHATYTGKGHQLRVEKSFLRTPQTDLTMDGIVSNKSSLAVRLRANDLRELEAIANLFRTPSKGNPLTSLDLAGKASFQGDVQGSTVAPHLTGQLSVLNLHFNGTDWKALRTNVDLTPSLLSLQHADLQPASKGRISFDASTGLDKWSFKNSSPLQIQLNASQINIADLTKLAEQQIPVTGTLNANVSLHGSALNPIGSGKITLTKVTAHEEPVTSLQLIGSGSGDEAHGDLSIQLPAGSVQSKFSIRPKDKTYKAQLISDGIDLNKLLAVKAKGIDVTGVIKLNADGQGTFDNPQLRATLQAASLVIHSQPVFGLNLEMNVANHVADAVLHSSAINSSIQAKAKVNLSGDYLADATLDTQGIPLQPLLAAYAPEEASGVSGQTEVHATLHGPLKNKNLIEGHVTIPILKMDYKDNIHLAAVSPIHLDYKNGIIDLQRAAIRGTDTDLQFQGSIPTSGNTPISFLLLGTVDLQLAQLFEPSVRSSGKLKFNINSYGASSGPNVAGQVEIMDANFSSEDLPVGLQHGNGVLTLTKDRMTISKFQGTVGGGTLTAQGGVAFQPSIQFDLGVAAQNVRILYPQGMRESVDANLRLTGSRENATLGGSVNLSNLSFTPAFDLPTFINQFSGEVSSPPTRGFSQNVALNVALKSTNNVNLTSRTLSINGQANLQVRGTAADPVILGRVNLNGGDIILNGNRYVLSSGTVQFVNPSETQPVVNLALTTSIQQYNINLRFNGPVAQMRTQYSSDPSLPQAEIIHLLALGTTTQASAQQATPAMQTAETLVASQVTSQVTSRISKIAGISQLSISPVLASSTQSSPGANITIQQRVTGNLFVTFSTNVASTQSQTIQGQYQLSPRVAVSATRDPNGGFAVDALIKKSW